MSVGFSVYSVPSPFGWRVATGLAAHIYPRTVSAVELAIKSEEADNAGSSVLYFALSGGRRPLSFRGPDGNRRHACDDAKLWPSSCRDYHIPGNADRYYKRLRYHCRCS